MGMLVNEYDWAVSGTVGVASAADVYTFYPGGAIEIMRSGVIAITSGGVDLATATSSFTMRVDKQAKSSAGAGWTRTSGAIGTLNFTTSATLGVNGKGIYADVTSGVTVNPGEGVIFAVTSAASAASTVMCFIQYRDLAFQGHGRPTSAPGDGATAGNIINMTKV